MRHRPRLLLPWITLCAAVVVSACDPEPEPFDDPPAAVTVEPAATESTPGPTPRPSLPEQESLTEHALDDRPGERGHPQFVGLQLYDPARACA